MPQGNGKGSKYYNLCWNIPFQAVGYFVTKKGEKRKALSTLAEGDEI
jgi:hypothetical protein